MLCGIEGLVWIRLSPTCEAFGNTPYSLRNSVYVTDLLLASLVSKACLIAEGARSWPAAFPCV